MKDGGFSKRPHAPIPKFDTRWLIGVAVIMPVALAAGVYWLHQQPAGSQNRSAGPIVEVKLVQEPRQAPAPVVAARPDQQAATGRVEPLVEAPKKPIPEERAVVASAPSATAVEPAEETSASPSPARQPSMSAGSSSAFQRQLLRHIARYLRYPKGAQTSQLHGIVYVRFAMRRDGSVTEAWILNQLRPCSAG